MSLKTLGKILLHNHLREEMGEVTVVYAEGNNVCNIKGVDVETLKNVSWVRSVRFGDEVIKQQSIHKVPADKVCFGESYGYWQLYFTYKGDSYKLERNDCKLNLEPIFNQSNLNITLFEIQRQSAEQCDVNISAKFEIMGTSATFVAIRGRPTIRGVKIRVQNKLDKDVSNTNLTFSQIHSSRSNDDAFVSSNKVELDKNRIKVDHETTSKDVLLYSFYNYNHFWKFNFTYKNYCYEMDYNDKYGKCINLCGNDYGFSLCITIFQHKRSAKVYIKFNINGKVNEILATKKESVQSRRDKFIQAAMDIRKPWLSNKHLVGGIIENLRSLALKVSDEKTNMTQLHSVDDDLRLFYPSVHPKLQFEEIKFRNRKLKVVSYKCNPDNEVQKLLKGICEKIENFTVAWNKISASLKDLQSIIETINTDEDDELDDVIQILNGMHVVQLINVVCNVLIVSGFDELGVTFYSSKQYLAWEISVDPYKLAIIIEEELKIVDQTVSFLYGIGNLRVDGNQNERRKYFVESDKPNKIVPRASLVHYQKSALRMTELLRLIRLEMIHCFLSISSELHLKNRNVNITTVTYSAAGLVGAGLAVVGLALAPVTVGLSAGLIISGICVGVVSGGVGMGTAITDGVLTNKYLESIVYLVKNDCYVSNLISVLRTMILKLDVTPDSCGVSSDGCQIPHSNSQFKTRAIAASTAGAVSSAGVVALKTGVQVARSAFFRAGFAAVGALFDLTSLTLKSINLSKGSCCEVGYKIESDALELEMELDDVIKQIDRLENASEAHMLL